MLYQSDFDQLAVGVIDPYSPSGPHKPCPSLIDGSGGRGRLPFIVAGGGLRWSLRFRLHGDRPGSRMLCVVAVSWVSSGVIGVVATTFIGREHAIETAFAPISLPATRDVESGVVEEIEMGLMIPDGVESGVPEV